MNKVISLLLFLSCQLLHAEPTQFEQTSIFINFLETVRSYFFELFFMFVSLSSVIILLKGKKTNQFIHNSLIKLKKHIESLEKATLSEEEKYKVHFDTNHDYISLILKNDNVIECSQEFYSVNDIEEANDAYEWVMRESYVDSEFKRKLIIGNKKFELVTNEFSVGTDLYQSIYFVALDKINSKFANRAKESPSLEKPILKNNQMHSEESNIIEVLRNKLEENKNIFIQKNILFDLIHNERQNDFKIELGEFILSKYLEKILLGVLSLTEYQQGIEKEVSIQPIKGKKKISLDFILYNIDFDQKNLMEEQLIEGEKTSLLSFLTKLEKDLSSMGLSFSIQNNQENALTESKMVFRVSFNSAQLYSESLYKSAI